MQYRINYGNGQVSETIGNYREAREALAGLRGELYADLARIQRYDGAGEWVNMGKAGRLATDAREGI